MDNLHVEKEAAHALYSSGRQTAPLTNCAAKVRVLYSLSYIPVMNKPIMNICYLELLQLGKTTLGAECSPSPSAVCKVHC